MAFSINNRLLTFAQQELVLGYGALERERIVASLDQLEKGLRDRLKPDVKEITRFGSFTRNTILPRRYDGHSDVDLLVIFHTESQKLTPGAYRERLLRVLSDAYPNSISRKDFPAIKLELNHIFFDVVPGYVEEFSWKKYYYIPDGRDGWRETTPNDLNEELSRKNQSYGGNIVRNVVRLCKHWNYGQNYAFESYLMEKDIVGTFFWAGDNLYDKFTSVLDSIAGERPGVKQALSYLKDYEYRGDVDRQFEWLRRLLPGLQR